MRVGVSCVIGSALLGSVLLGAPAKAGDTDAAVRLVSIMAFVSDYCPELRVNKTAFAAAMYRTGVSSRELQSDELNLQSAALLAGFVKHRRSACTAALITVGPKGEFEPDLVAIK